MLKRSWLQALAVVVCAAALTACGGGDSDECKTTSDCKGTPPSGQEYQCINSTCQLKAIPKTCSPACASGEVCDVSSGTGVCKTCTAKEGCTAPLFCDAAANSGKGVCRACADTSSTGTDQGCSAAAPVCDPAGGSGAGVCKACTDTASGAAADLGCSVSTPMCDPAANNGAGICQACVDSAAGSAQDLGCSASSPVCDPASANGVGACKTCVDSAAGMGTDTGCTDAAPMCNTSANGGRGQCRACADTATGTGTDSGCADTAPICDLTANNGAGSCKSCVDTATGTGTDTGCGATTPLCDPAGNSGAGACNACLDSATGTGTDLGCTSAAALCDPAAASGSGACRACLNTSNTPSTADLGCASPTALCDPAANNSVGACKVCVGANEGCAGTQTCNAEGTACEGCADSSECTNPSTPVCKPPPPVAICVECTTNANCAATRPVCDTATNFCGCTADAQCASAPGNTDYCDTDPSVNNGRGLCTECLTDAHCAGNATRPFCDNRTACIQCRSNADCSVPQSCSAATKTCETLPDVNPTETSARIQEFLNAPSGTLDPAIIIPNGFVTYIKPPVGTDDPGFFVQAQPDGPAMFVAVNATTHQLQVGDRITFSVGQVLALNGGLEAAASISNLTIHDRGHPVQNLNTASPAGLAADRSTANDLQTNVIAGYESELIRLTGTIASAVGSQGTGHVAYNITTQGMTTSATNFKLRVPDTFPDLLDIVQTCSFTLKAGPMWRFTSGTTPVNNAQPSAYYTTDLSFSGCPAPKLVTAAARSTTQVVLTFDRRISPSSVLSDGSQFTFPNSNGLTASAAVASGRQITLTTSEQTPGTDYTVNVADTVKDLNGNSVVAPANVANFRGYRVPATLRITEVQPNMASSADLVELVALTAGTVDGFLLQQDINSATTLATFPNATVAAGDMIVVHINPGTGYVSETTSKTQFPTSTTAVNYDTAWDFGGGTSGITYSARLVLVRDAAGNIQDAGSFGRTDGTPPSAFPGNLQALQAAGQWLPVDCAGNPCTLTTVPSALDVSADWTGMPTNSTTTSNSVQRITGSDTNMRADWGVGAPTWGVLNP